MKVERPKIIRLELDENEIKILDDAREILSKINKEIQYNMMISLHAKRYEDILIIADRYDLMKIVETLQYLTANDITLEG